MRTDVYEKVSLYKMNELKPKFTEVARTYGCDPRTVKRYYDGAQKTDVLIKTLQESVDNPYSSKSFNELLPSYHIIRSMSRAGTPTDNAAMESIIGWMKEEIFNDFNIKDSDDPVKTVE